MADGVKGHVPPIIRGRRSATLGVAKPAQKVIPPTTAASTTSKGAPDDAGTGGDRGSRPRTHNMQAAARAMDRATGMSADASRTRAGAASASTGPLSPLRSSTSRVALALEVVGATGLVSKGQSAPFVRLSLGSGVADTERCREKLAPSYNAGWYYFEIEGLTEMVSKACAHRISLSSTEDGRRSLRRIQSVSDRSVSPSNEHAGRCGLRRIRSAADAVRLRVLSDEARKMLFLGQVGGTRAHTHPRTRARAPSYTRMHRRRYALARTHRVFCSPHLRAERVRGADKITGCGAVPSRLQCLHALAP